MKRLVLIVLLLTTAGFAQETPKATLIDEIGKTSCEDVLARSDNLGIMLQEKRVASAVMVLFANENGAKLDWQIRFIQRALIGRIGNNLNVRFFRGTDNGESRLEIWAVPDGVTFEKHDFRMVAQLPLKIGERTLFQTETGDPCSNHAFAGFANMLKSDRDLNGYIVNVNYSKRERRKTVNYYEDLFREHQILDRRVRILFKNKRVPANLLPTYSEYWLVPTNK